MRAFSPKVLSHWGNTLIEPIATTRIERFIADGKVELVEQVGHITTRVVIAVLGLPWDDENWIDRFLRIHRDGFLGLLAYQGSTAPPREQIDAALASVAEVKELLLPHVTARRSGDGSDFISQVWRGGAELFGTEDFSAEDVMSHAMAAFSGGSASTATQACNALYLVMSQPGLQEKVLHAEDGFARLREESLRLFSTTEWRPRRALRDLEIGGVHIKAGERVVALNAAGSTDGRHANRPYEVDLTRRSPRDHFGFSMGPRICAGQALARFQLERILQVMLTRLEDLRIDPDAPQPVWAGGPNRAWTPLHALFDVSTT
jgi:cytochrome P450